MGFLNCFWADYRAEGRFFGLGGCFGVGKRKKVDLFWLV
jgi:hypothetical protein